MGRENSYLHSVIKDLSLFRILGPCAQILVNRYSTKQRLISYLPIDRPVVIPIHFQSTPFFVAICRMKLSIPIALVCIVVAASADDVPIEERDPDYHRYQHGFFHGHNYWWNLHSSSANGTTTGTTTLTESPSPRRCFVDSMSR